MADQLGQEAFDRNAHHASAAEGSHVAEDVGGVDPLLGDLHLTDFDQVLGHAFHDLRRQTIFHEKLLISLQRTHGKVVRYGREVERELNVHVEAIGVDGLQVGPVIYFFDEEKTTHGVELFRWGSHVRREMLCEDFDRKSGQGNEAEGTLPAIEEVLAGSVSQDGGELVKEVVLLRISDVPHIGLQPILYQ